MRRIVLPFLAILGLLSVLGVDNCHPEPISASGVTKADAKVVVGSDGLTTEQRNIRRRLEQDNKPGAIQHLYVISAYSGQVLIYSTVQGKVTSSGKRLTPSHLSQAGVRFELPLREGQHRGDMDTYEYTDEMIGDDGTYGSSEPYLYWYDTKGTYHQHYVAGGQIIHVSDQPLSVKSVIINMEVTGDGAVPPSAPIAQ